LKPSYSDFLALPLLDSREPVILEATLGRARVRRILEAFARQILETERELAPTSPGNRAHALGQALHMLKSSAGGLGAKRLTAVAHYFELELENGATTLPRQLEWLDVTLKETREELARFLAAARPSTR